MQAMFDTMTCQVEHLKTSRVRLVKKGQPKNCQLNRKDLAKCT